MKYKQCGLTKTLTAKNCCSKVGHATCRLVSWIPEKYAVVGKTVKLKNGDIWENGWVVDTVGYDAVDEKDLPDAHKAKKVHRKRTGDSLPKEK